MTRADRVRISAVLISTCIALPLFLDITPAHAQSVEAEALFRQGRALMERGQLEEAAEKLAASDRLEASAGTLLNLGECQEQLGRVASAWASFRRAESIARRNRDPARRHEARRRAEELEAHLSYLRIEIAAPSRVDGLSIRRGDAVIDPVVWNATVPIDPGTHVIVAEAPGRLPWRDEVVIDGERQRKVVVVPTLEIDPEAAALAARARAREEASARDAVLVERGPTALRKVSIGMMVVGIGALGGGVVYGLQARDLSAEADRLCPTSACADPEGLRLSEDAQDAALRANALYAASGVAAITAIVMWIAGAPPSASPSAPGVRVKPTFEGSSRSVGLAISGSF